jgi:dTMP kinase
MSGRFIVIEGPNGVGKTTVAASLAERLQRHSSPVHVTREPSHSALGELIRSSTSRRAGRHQRPVCAVLAGLAAPGRP